MAAAERIDSSGAPGEHRSGAPHARSTVCIEPTARGWKIVGAPPPVEARRRRRALESRFATFEDAMRAALEECIEARPCELIVRDVYHRVVRRELIVGGAASEGR